MTEGPYPNHLGRFMRERGLTDPDLARVLDISKQQIFNLRRGHRKLTVEWARRLAPHLNVSWQELITGSPGSPSDPWRAALLAAFDAMDERGQETLVRIAESLRRDDPPNGTRPKGPEPPPAPERPPPSRPTTGRAVAEDQNNEECEKIVPMTRVPG